MLAGTSTVQPKIPLGTHSHGVPMLEDSIELPVIELAKRGREVGDVLRQIAGGLVLNRRVDVKVGEHAMSASSS